MEQANSIIQIISTVGFPIAMCLILMFYIKYKEDQMKEITDAHKQEMLSFTIALNNNTTALNKLCDKIEK